MATVVVIDTETTGLRPFDRLITLAAIRSVDGSSKYELLYRCFDPRKDSEASAVAVHGWDNWTTRFQDLFADHARELHAWLSSADTIVAHNAAFDLHYVNRELRKCEIAPLSATTFCTMEASRERWSGKVTLDACAERIGIRRTGEGHLAVEDAFIAWNLYRNLTGLPLVAPPATWGRPDNYRPPLPRPDGVLPRRSRKTPGKSGGLWAPSQRDDVFDASRPLAIITLHVAATNGRIEPGELAIIEGIVVRAAARRGLPHSPADVADVARRLADIGTSRNLLTRAVGAIVHDSDAREALPKIMATIAAAEGAITPDKRTALDQIKAAIVKRIRGD
ncbi:MAG: hypothetical protein DI527_00910 [Chelatococcus sp.]|nr:MAG: hypothetical protein DI527_00910 [Chelatococcus sp.]